MHSFFSTSYRVVYFRKTFPDPATGSPDGSIPGVQRPEDALCRTIVSDARQFLGQILRMLDIMVSIDGDLFNDRRSTPVQSIDQLVPSPYRRHHILEKAKSPMLVFSGNRRIAHDIFFQVGLEFFVVEILFMGQRGSESARDGGEGLVLSVNGLSSKHSP